MSKQGPISRGALRLTVVAAIFAVVFGRALGTALPGSRSGLDKILQANWLVGAFCTQLLAVLLVVVVGRLASALWVDGRFSVSHRIIMTLAAATVIVLVIAASSDVLLGPYTPEVSLVLGIAGTLVAMRAASISLKPTDLRASGIVLLLVATASMAQVSARLLALQAGDAALLTQYNVARWLASLATLLDALALILTAVWLALLWTGGRYAVVATLVSSVFLGQLSLRGSRPSAGLAEVLLSRSLAQLHREPSSFFPRLVQNTQELFAILIVGVLLWQPRRVLPEQRLALAMVLLARSSPDIPLCCGLLVAGALGLSLLTADAQESSLQEQGQT